MRESYVEQFHYKGYTTMKIQIKKILSITLLFSGLVLLSSCGEDKTPAQKAQDAASLTHEIDAASQKAAAGKKAVAVDGKTVLTQEDFSRNLALLQQQQPQLAYITAAPEDQQRQIYMQLAEGFAGRPIICEHVKKQGWHEEPQYKENARRVFEDVECELADRELQNRILQTLSLTDSDAQSYYKKNADTNPYFKETPFVIERESVKTVAVKAQDEEQAKKLAEAARKSGDLKKAAADLKLTAQDLGFVTAESTQPDRLVVMKALSMQKFPSVETVKSGTSTWVVQGINKKAAELAPFEQVKDYVKEVMKIDKFQTKYLEEVQKLRAQHSIDIDKDFIESLIVKAPKAQ